MGEEINKYKFDNLQPITFLRKFNKMVQQDTKHPIKQTRNQLKIYPLSKFPIPQFYYKMEGIFETGTKKKDVINFNIKSKQDIQDEQFLAKHRNFMTKAIQKIIKDNESQQQTLQNYKQQYNTQRKVDGFSKKSFSQTKFKNKVLPTSVRNQTHRDHIPQLHRNQDKSQNQQARQQPKRTYLQKIQIQRYQSLRNQKKQKIRLRNSQKIDQFLDTRKNFKSSRTHDQNSLNQIKTARTIQYNNMTAQDWKKSFLQGLFNLQKQQNRFQNQYSSKIEQQIAKFNQKADSSIEKTKKQKFW